MSILTGEEIINKVKDGSIYIDNFNEKKVNPNSYNLTLNNRLLIYDNMPLDCKKENIVKEIIIPESGFILQPGQLYLGSTNEFTSTNNLVPVLDGRSSIGRLGIFIHITAGFGDIGFKGKWTLEIMTIHPTIIYPDIELCQISYHTIEGDSSIKYKGKYQNSNEVNSSKLFKEL